MVFFRRVRTQVKAATLCFCACVAMRLRGCRVAVKDGMSSCRDAYTTDFQDLKRFNVYELIQKRYV
jgi:hypothetical protein